jgi:sedoheptulokinase
MVQEVSWTELITWEDQRCTPDFLTQIQVVGNLSPMKSSPLATGYGLATFAYILQHTPEQLQGFDCCGTIQDFIAYVLCGKKASSETFMDITNAYSWGAFDSESHTWNRNT